MRPGITGHTIDRPSCFSFGYGLSQRFERLFEEGFDRATPIEVAVTLCGGHRAPERVLKLGAHGRHARGRGSSTGETRLGVVSLLSEPDEQQD